MALQKQPLSFTFSGGIHTKADAKTVPTTKLLGLENAQFIKQMTLAKRNGYRALGRTIDGTSVRIEGPVGLAHRDTGPTAEEDNELVLFTPARAYSYRPSTDEWSDTGDVASVAASDSVLVRTGTAQTMPDHATVHGITVFAWEDSLGGVWISVVESTTFRILLKPTQLDASGISPRCVVAGDVLHVYYAKVGQVWCAIVNPVVPFNVPVPTLLIEDLSAIQTYDAVSVVSSAFGGINAPLIAWSTALGYRVGWVSPSGVLGSPTTGLPSVAAFEGATDLSTGGIAVACRRDGNRGVAVVWNDATNNLRARFTELDFVVVTGTAALGVADNSWLRVSAEFADDAGAVSTLWVAAEDGITTGRQDHNQIMSACVTSDGTITVSGGSRILLGHMLLSRAFYDVGSVYAALVHPVKYFPYVAVVRLSGDAFGTDGTSGSKPTGTSVANLLPGLSTGAPTRQHVASVHFVGDDSGRTSRQHALCLGYRIQLSSENGDQFGEAGVRLQDLDFAHPLSYGSAQLGQGLYLGGAVIGHYDGSRWAEASFFCAPDVDPSVTPPLTASVAGGGLTPHRIYGYHLCYEEIDAQGELHQGATSILYSIDIQDGDTITVDIPMLRLSGKSMVRIGVYRSRGNDSSEFFRVTSLDSTVSGDNGYVANDPSVQLITWVDKMSDADLQTKEPLYTNGGILSNDPAPSAGSVIAVGKSRMFWTDPSDSDLVRFSQEILDDAAVDMSASLSMRTDSYGGAVVGIGILDDAVIAFKETAIYATEGPGPDADGGQLNPNNSFAPFQLLTSDVGCKSPGSICQTPLGLAFQSSKGIKLLGRDRQVVDIGADVYAYNSQTITRATLLPDRHQVVFLTGEGSTLLWDYEKQQWSTFTNHLGFDGEIVDGVYHYLRTDGRVFQETPGEYADDGSQITMSIQTAWIKMTGQLQNWQKVLVAMFVGEWQSPHTLRVRYALDYEAGWSAPFDIDVNSVYNPDVYGAGLYGAGPYGGTIGTSNTVYQESIHLNRRCQAIRFWIEDVQATGDNGASFTLAELMLVGGVVGVKRPLGAARQG